MFLQIWAFTTTLYGIMRTRSSMPYVGFGIFVVAMLFTKALHPRHGFGALSGLVVNSQDTTHAYVVINRRRIETSEAMIFTILVEDFFVRAIYGRLFDSQDLCEYRTVELLGTQENVVLVATHRFVLVHLQRGAPARHSFRAEIKGQLRVGPVGIGHQANNPLPGEVSRCLPPRLTPDALFSRFVR